MVDAFKNIDWESFHFLRPLFLWLLLPVFVIFAINLISTREQIKWKKIIAPHLRQYVIKKGSESLKKWMQALSFIVMSIAILGISGPTWDKIELPGKTLETPFVIVLDLSQSMLATDIQPTRLERAKFKINDLLDANPKARIALVGFAGTAHTIIPLTRDYKIIKSHIDGLSPRMMPYQGTNLKAALEIVDTLTNVTTAPATVLLISDDFTDDTFNLLQQFVINNNTSVEVLPINTLSGADVPNFSGRGTMHDAQGKVVHSALDTSILTKLNSIDKINVNDLTLDKSDVELLAKKISENLEFKEDDKEDDWQDRGLWFVIPFAFLVLLSFRKGWVIYSLLIMVTFSSCNSESTFKDLWYTKDYQAQKLANTGDYILAAKTFESPLRKGIAYYKAGNYDEAINAFSQDTTAIGAYNLGIAFYKNGDYAAAEIAFGKAIELDPTMEDAQKNQTISQQLSGGENEVNPQEAQEADTEKGQAQNQQNKSPEDLSGGGQEATKKDMEKERLEETTETDVRKGKELDEVPDKMEFGKQDQSQKILMRKVDDDPSLFLKRKFAHQVKEKNIKPENTDIKW